MNQGLFNKVNLHFNPAKIIKFSESYYSKLPWTWQLDFCLAQEQEYGPETTEY